MLENILYSSFSLGRSLYRSGLLQKLLLNSLELACERRKVPKVFASFATTKNSLQLPITKHHMQQTLNELNMYERAFDCLSLSSLIVIVIFIFIETEMHLVRLHCSNLALSLALSSEKKMPKHRTKNLKIHQIVINLRFRGVVKVTFFSASIDCMLSSS